MQTTTLSFANLHQHGDLFANLFRARRQSFIVQNGWDLPEALGMEYDQYDTPASRWIAVHDGGTILAGVRLTSTTARCGIYSYMIRDAQQGLLGGLPADLLDQEAPVDANIWESSRLFVSHETPMSIRRKVHALLNVEMTKSAEALGAHRVIGIIPSNWPRWAARCNMDVEAAGRVLEFEGYESQAVWVNIIKQTH
jgi:N-acyl-L-homoserine lactone synthetase